MRLDCLSNHLYKYFFSLFSKWASSFLNCTGFDSGWLRKTNPLVLGNDPSGVPELGVMLSYSWWKGGSLKKFPDHLTSCSCRLRISHPSTFFFFPHARWTAHQRGSGCTQCSSAWLKKKKDFFFCRRTWHIIHRMTTTLALLFTGYLEMILQTWGVQTLAQQPWH